MKSRILGCTLAALAGVSTMAPGLNAQAEQRREEGKVTSILYSCNLDFRATGRSIYIGIGYTDIHGKGSISCYDLLHGTTQILPVKVKAHGPGVGLGVTGLVLSGAAAGIGVSRGPENLLGHYVSVRGNAAVGVGAGGAIGLRLSKGAVNVDVSVQAETGLGAGVDILWLNIEPDGDMRVEAAPTPPPPPPPVEQAPPPVPQPAEPTTTAVITSEKTTTEKTKIIYISEGQPLQIMDAKGQVIQTIYLRAQNPQ